MSSLVAQRALFARIGILRVGLARIGLAALLAVTLLMAGALCAADPKKPPARPVNLNTAPVAELKRLSGIGPALAERIIRHREKSGKFRSVDELLVIRGISRKKLEALRPYLTVEEEAEEAKEAEEAAEKD